MTKTTNCIIQEKIFKEDLMSQIMGLFTTANGQKMGLGMVKAHKYGKMGPNTLAIGKMIKHMEKGDLFMQMEMYMKEIG